MSAHTPGPWTITDAFGPEPECEFCFHEILGPGGRTVASTWAGPNIANARLIAAAPEMLEALQELVEFLNDQADADDGIPNNAMRHLVEVTAAIAKATGGAS